MAFINSASSADSKPKSASVGRSWLKLSKRKTIFSPCTVGKELTRISTVWFLYGYCRRPSCGRRFSAISMRASTLMRETMASRMDRGGWAATCKRPSIRKRTRNDAAPDSTWTSDAPNSSARCNNASNCWTAPPWWEAVVRRGILATLFITLKINCGNICHLTVLAPLKNI